MCMREALGQAPADIGVGPQAGLHAWTTQVALADVLSPRREAAVCHTSLAEVSGRVACAFGVRTRLARLDKVRPNPTFGQCTSGPSVRGYIYLLPCLISLRDISGLHKSIATSAKA